MIGAIAGDIIGSVYEWNNIKTKDFPLFAQNAHFTDDTVLTVALAESILSGTPYAEICGAFTTGTLGPDTEEVFADGHKTLVPARTTIVATARPCSSSRLDTL